MARCGKTGHRRAKRIPYGSKKGFYWCWGCDAELVPLIKGLKKSARAKAKRQIKKELKEE